MRHVSSAKKDKPKHERVTGGKPIMLKRVNTVHQPNNLDEAERLVNAETRPLYGGVALHREAPGNVTAVVNLEKLGLDQARVVDGQIVLGSMMSLEDARQACLQIAEEYPNAGLLAEMIRQEAPLTLRNTMTVGDVMIERQANSVILTALTALSATIQLKANAVSLADWLAADDENIRPMLITEIHVPKGSNAAHHAYQKVSRTPADAPIVAAIAYVEPNETIRVALCGVASHPVTIDNVTDAILQDGATVHEALEQLDVNPVGDHWGSAEYRTAMGRLMAHRVLDRALA